MADSGMPTMIKVAALGGAAYLAYEWWQGQSAAASPAASPSTLVGTTSGAAAAGAAGSSSGAPVASVPTAPAYTGPSLAAIYAQLVAAAQAGAASGDTAVNCGGAGVSGFGAVMRGGVRAPSGVPTTRQIVPIGQAPTCANPMASFDVWNWYFVNRVAAWPTLGVSAVQSSDAGVSGSTQMSASQFWAAVAPLLQQRVAGLSGYRRRRGFGDDATTAADYAALVVSAQQGGYDTSAPVVPASGISGGVLAVGIGAALLLLGAARG